MLNDFLKSKHKISLCLFLASFALSSCTAHQSERIREMLTVSQGPFERQKAVHIVRESLAFPSSTFHLDLQSADPLTTAKGVFPVILLQANPLPVGETFIFATVDPLTDQIDARFEFTVLEGGNLEIRDRFGIRQEKQIPFVDCEGLLPGKSVIYALVSKQSYTAATVEFTPYPLAATSEDGATIHLQVTHPMLTRFLCEADGFRPYEAITLIHQSETHTEEIEVQADETGKVTVPLNPTLLGKLGGHAHLQVVRKSGEMHLDYPWGAKLEKKGLEGHPQFPVLFVVNQSLEHLNTEIVQNTFASTPSLQ